MKLTEKISPAGSRFYLQKSVEIDGKMVQKKFPMGTDKKAAKTKANRFLATLSETGLSAALDELGGGNPVKAGDSPTLAQIETHYRAFLAQSAKPLKEKTIYDNLGALGRIMKAIGAETISQIDGRTLRGIMLGKDATDEQLRGFGSTVRQAKSIFKPA